MTNKRDRKRSDQKKKFKRKKVGRAYLVERAFGSDYSPLPTFGDADGDGVPNFFDCKPRNPNKDGILQDVGEAIKTRVKHTVGDVKERVIEDISGEEAREERLEVEETRKESRIRERKKAAEEEEKIRARAKIERHKEEEKELKEARRRAIRRRETHYEEKRREAKEARKTKTKERTGPYGRKRETTVQRPSPFSSGYLR